MKSLLRSCVVALMLFGAYAGVASAVTPADGGMPRPCPPCGNGVN